MCKGEEESRNNGKICFFGENSETLVNFDGINMYLLHLNVALILTDKCKAALKDTRVMGEGRASSVSSYNPQKGPGVSSEPTWTSL